MTTDEFECIEENTILYVVNHTTYSILRKTKGKSKTFVFPVSQISKYSSQSRVSMNIEQDAEGTTLALEDIHVAWEDAVKRLEEIIALGDRDWIRNTRLYRALEFGYAESTRERLMAQSIREEVRIREKGPT